MQLISVQSAKRTAIEGVLDLVLTADLGGGNESLPFTYAPGDPYGLGPAVAEWLAANPGFAIADYVAPMPSTDPAKYPLSDRQLRIGLLMNGIPLSTVDNAIAGIADATEQAIAKVWWDRTTLIHWDHPMTQTLLTLAGFTTEQASAMWLVAKDLAA